MDVSLLANPSETLNRETSTVEKGKCGYEQRELFVYSGKLMPFKMKKKKKKGECS